MEWNIEDADAEVNLETGIAECASEDWMDAPLVVSGVAIGENEVTRTPSDETKIWPRETLKEATSTLEGVHLTKNHNHDTVEGVIGEITKADYKDGVGVLFEAHLHDEEVAEKVRKDLLEVSIHAAHMVGERDDEGNHIVVAAAFLDLSIVPRGEAESNTVSPGPMASAALSRQGLADVVEESFGTGKDSRDSDSDDAHAGADESTPESDTEGGSVFTDSDTDTAERDDGPDADSNVESAQSSSAEMDSTSKDADMTEETQEDDAELNEAPDADEDVPEEELSTEESEAEESEAELSDEGSEAEEDALDAEELEARVHELEDELEALREEKEALLGEVESVRAEYAEVLSEGSAFSAEELAEKFSTDELATKYEEADVSLAESESKPAPQTGGMDDSEESELEATDDGTQEEIAELEAQIAQYEEAGWDAAADEYRAQLAELTDDE